VLSVATAYPCLIAEAPISRSSAGSVTPLARLLSTELARDFRRTVGNRVHRDMLLQFIDKRATALPDLRRVGPSYTMHEFSKG
jgi:hypothetical protein